MVGSVNILGSLGVGGRREAWCMNPMLLVQAGPVPAWGGSSALVGVGRGKAATARAAPNGKEKRGG